MSIEQTTTAINGYIDRISRHQRALSLSDSAFCQRYGRYLGSVRTWKDRLLKKDLRGLKLDATETRLRNMVAELDGCSRIENFILQMPFTVRMTALYNQLQTQQSDRRCGVCLGVTGVGKSAWARHIVNQHPREAAYVRANETWRDSRTQISQGLAEALGCAPVDFTGAAICMARIVTYLRKNPSTIIIDEAHEAGVMLLKLVKTLIDDTSSRFILLCYPTTWNRMLTASDDARSEAQQLFGRTLKPVFADYAQGLRREDITAYLRASTALNEEADEVAGQIISMVRANGNLRLVADAVDNAGIQSDAQGEPLSSALLVEHVKALCPTMNGGDK